MQLVFHTGAHFTEEDRLMRCLLRNREAFRDRGVSVPGPGKYRRLLRDTLKAMSDAALAPDAREVLLDAILDDDNVERVILSHAHIFGWPRAAVRRGLIYPHAPVRMANLATIFHRDDIELFMAIRNPATFLPACFEKNPREDLEDFMGGIDPRTVKWSDTFLRIREAAPEIPITVWCNEDAPLLWPQIIREFGGLEHGQTVVGGFDLFGDIMSQEGMNRFAAYLETKPPMTEIHLRRVMAAFLDKFALDEEIEEELDIPGWSDETVREMTDIYEDDVFAIARIPGVEMISL